MKLRYALLLAPLLLCGCSGTAEEIPPQTNTNTTEAQPQTEEFISAETPFSDTIEEAPDEEDLTLADPLDDLEITPSDYFAPGVWTSINTDDTGNFYIFDEDGIHGRIVPMSDADGVDFAYSISGSNMKLYVGEEFTPYSAELERTDEGHVIIHMTYLGTQDELTLLSGVSAGDFNFYPAARLAEMAKIYYKQQSGTEPVGVEYIISENDMVVLNLWVSDENGWRSDVESYTVSMFTAAGWSSITYEDIDLSLIEIDAATEDIPDDDIPDVVE